MNIHRVDNHIIKLEKHSLDKWSLKLNNEEIAAGFGGLKRGKLAYHATISALKNTDYKYEEFVQDRVKTDAMPDNDAARYVLSRVYSDGDVDDITYHDDDEKLIEEMVNR